MWVIHWHLEPDLGWLMPEDSLVYNILETWDDLQRALTYYPDAEYHPLFRDES
jgi:hypothetical protein